MLRPNDLFAKVPLAPFIVAFGLLLAVSTWLGMRSVESSEAEVAYSRDLLEGSIRIEANLDQAAKAMAAMTESIRQGPTSATAAEQYLKGAGLMAFDDKATAEPILAVAGARLDGDTVSIEMLITPTGVTESAVEFDLADDPALARAIERAQSGETMIGETDSLAAAFGLDFPPDTPLSVMVQQSASADSFVAIALIDIATIKLPFESDALEIRAEVLQDGVSRSGVDLIPENQFGEPFEFIALGSEWTIVGQKDFIEADHSGSWLLLFAGTLFAGAAGLLAQAIRRQSIVLGRLDRTEHDATHDPLTGLLNRSGLTPDLEERLADRRGNNLVGVLFLDLDRLKVVNDSLGHSAGDEVLAIVADRLRTVVRDGDIIARFGGDEFVVVSSGLPAIRDLTGLAQRVLDALGEPATLSDESNQMIGGSIGIAYVTKGTATAESLLRDADLAMYRAKEGGGGRYEVFDAELRAAALARLEVERELRRAIRTGQLVVHYQPIVDVDTGRVTKLEALVRWQHPVKGMIPPGAFLSVAAESGLIVDVGEHVLREACRQARVWSEAVGRPVSVAVNVAERQLIDGHLVETVRRVLAETELDPHQLELEISEELIVERLDGHLHLLHELVDMGVGMALDDFGTSRASLSSLKRLDMVKTLKIDRAFVIDVATDPVDRKIITAIVALAHSVGMEVVAEGVEDADQATVLQELGVSKIQGFYFARPDTSDKVVTSLTKRYDLPWDPTPAVPAIDVSSTEV